MPRISFIYRNDVHVSETSPASWKGDYASEVYSNLEQVGKLAKEHSVTAVLDGGDYFHVKAASRNPHFLITRTARIHQAYGCPTFCIEGNHDIAYNNLETLERQPLGVLYATSTFQHLKEEVFKDGSVTVRVVGVPYSPFRTAADIRSIQKKPGDDFLMVVIHSLAGEDPPPQVEEFFNEPVFRYEDLITPDGADIFAFGHWHKDQGIVDIKGRKFINQGALSRGALINENLTRTPKVSLIEFLPGEFKVTACPMVVAAAEDVFDMERKERQEQENREIGEFVKSLAIMADDVNSKSSIAENIQKLGFASDVKRVIFNYLERARLEAGVG